ncbi:MAG: hypothetical protein WBQ23_04525 [Bacteroidota bacterium]
MLLMLLDEGLVERIAAVAPKVDTVLVRDTLFIPFEYLEHIQNYYDTLSQGLIGIVAIAIAILGWFGIDNILKVRRGTREIDSTSKRVNALRLVLDRRYKRLDTDIQGTQQRVEHNFIELTERNGELEQELRDLMRTYKFQSRQTNMVLFDLTDDYLTKFRFLVFSSAGLDAEEDLEFIHEILEYWIHLLDTDRFEAQNEINYVFLLRGLEINLRNLRLDEPARALLNQILGRHRGRRPE